LLLEKAYAKLHGNYFTLRGGFANEGMIDLTGCPTECFDFEEDEVQDMIKSGELFQKIKEHDDLGYLISASTPGEDVWTETGGPEATGGLVPGHAYSVIEVKEVYGHQLLQLRNPWGSFEWDGDWGDNSDLWTP
jgi:calpain-15